MLDTPSSSAAASATASAGIPSKTCAAIATTPAALRQLQQLNLTNLTIWVSPALAAQAETSKTSAIANLHSYGSSLKDKIAELWPKTDRFIFTLASGAVVRLVAPLLQNKATDPAIAVLDEAGQFVISLCGGHQGGADQLARAIAAQLGAQAILTGAASAQQRIGIDVLGEPFGWTQGSGDWLGVSAALARQEAVQVIQEAGSELWQQHLPENHGFQFGFGGEADADPGPSAQARVWISAVQRQFSDEGLPKVQWHPRVLWIGVGCERGSSRQLIETAVIQTLAQGHWAQGAVAGIATLDLKGDEEGLLELCQDMSWPLRCFTADELKDIAVPTPSEIVAREVGTPSVAEAAAIAASASRDLVTSNLVTSNLVTSKQIIRQDNQPGVVTVAIAQATEEYTDRPGHLSLIGTGPGALDQITPAAKTALIEADAVIGYGLYIDLIRPLLRPGQIVEPMPITKERARAKRAIALANWGLNVAVISSGDSGIYGMAGLVMESLSQAGWNGKTPSVQVFPGITALQAAAARVGTPLMHDFCAISLSDLLTPWAVIEKRLKAAAAADFVVALYNPKSKTRVTQLASAREFFLEHRKAETPVALVRSVYRDDEQLQLTTLGELNPDDVDMLTVVLIGNASTLRHGHWLITPRGYLGFGDESA